LAQTLFELGRTYKRSDIHDAYGGSRQSGISPTAKFPHIFIFSSETGHQHGYKDQWENDDVFSYTGEGQANDMNFIRGNLALKNHIRNGKRVFLFIYESKGKVRFEAELELIDFDFFIGPDTKGKERTGIKFFFKRIGKKLNYQTEISKDTFVPDIS
jgi:5-methylcytosine-specific restriction enzyme A